MFTIYPYKIDLISEPFANLKFRDKTVLILIRNSKGQFILESGDYYPPGISRMLGGGVEVNEDVTDAAVREIREEIGLHIEKEMLQELVQVHIEGIYKTKVYKTQISVFSLKVPIDSFHLGDDVSEVSLYSEDQYRELVKKYLELKADHFKKAIDYSFSWKDYGRVYGFVHEMALDEFLKRK